MCWSNKQQQQQHLTGLLTPGSVKTIKNENCCYAFFGECRGEGPVVTIVPIIRVYMQAKCGSHFKKFL